MDQIDVIILAGGEGRRLRSAWDGPKVLAPVGGRPFLSYVLDQLVAVSVERVIICTGYCAEQIESTFGTTYRSMQLIYSPETQPLGTAGAIRQAIETIPSDHVVVLNGDSWCETNLTDFHAWHHRQNREASMVLTEVPNMSRYGGVVTNTNERITQFQEKGFSGPGWINAGVYCLARKFLDRIPRGAPVSLERDIFPQWVGSELYGYRSNGRFLDIGTPDSYSAAEGFFKTLC